MARRQRRRRDAKKSFIKSIRAVFAAAIGARVDVLRYVLRYTRVSARDVRACMRVWETVCVCDRLVCAIHADVCECAAGYAVRYWLVLCV